jgi:5-methylcytosine-specific restriction endonuclease McrA
MAPQAVLLHPPRSPRWLGDPRQYQREAQLSYAAFTGRPVLPWSWVTTSCDLTDCLDPECMTAHAPTHIDYPAGICTYCGMPSGTRDHLIPRAISGETGRSLIAVVPACADCNSRIGDSYAVSVTERRAIAHAALRRKHRRVLSVPDKTEADLAELGPSLRSVAVKNNNTRAWIRDRLAWPFDPNYDLRAFQRSGIEDPTALGLI